MATDMHGPFQNKFFEPVRVLFLQYLCNILGIFVHLLIALYCSLLYEYELEKLLQERYFPYLNTHHLIVRFVHYKLVEVITLSIHSVEIIIEMGTGFVLVIENYRNYYHVLLLVVELFTARVFNEILLAYAGNAATCWGA